MAPMADVTDCAFRQIIAKCEPPDVFWTEFVSADGLAHKEARKKLLIDLKFSKNEHPIVAQLFGSNPENIESATRLCKKLGFDGIDINMGCPDRAIEKQNSGASMIKDLKKAREIIESARKGSGGLPVSVKTRIGYAKNETETWLRGLLEENLPALTVHLRTRKEMSKVPAHWELMKRIVELRNEISPETLIIGNGDVKDLEEGRKKVKKYKCDGIMIGRGIFGSPWLFSEREVNLEEKLEILIRHAKLFEKLIGKYKSFAVMKKHFKAYVNDFPGAKELRTELMKTKNAKGVGRVVKNFLKSL